MADTLNKSQLEAVRWKGGPLIVLAGPGTGKTRVIAHRVRWLVEQHDAPESIVAVTYTVKAAGQLRERLAESIGPEKADRVNVHTFHGLGMRLIRRFGDVLGLPAAPDLIDSAQSKRLLRELVNENRLFPEAIASGRDAAIERAVRVMGMLEDHAVDPAEALARAETWALKAREIKDEEGQAEVARAEEFRGQARLYDLYDKARRRRGWLSYGDLITLPIRLLSRDGRAAQICRGEFKHFIVDEFQDSNPAQLELLRRLAPARSADVCVVGDDDQSIYAFRGADDRAFEHFKRVWPAAGEVRLSENYRSTPEIVAATNRIISLAPHRFAPDKTIVAAGKHQAPGSVECIPLAEDFADGAAIAAAILSDRAAVPGRALGSYAVLARAHGDLDRVAGALELEGIAVRRQRARSPLDDAGVQDVFAWIELLVSDEESWHARRLLLRPPFSLDPLVVTTWEKLFKAEDRRARRDGGRRTGFVAWLGAQHARAAAGEEDAPAGLADPRVATFLARHAELRLLAANTAADETIYQIVTRTDAAHADLPAEAGGLARSRRVADLVTLVRFARARQTRLSSPGDLHAFLEYYRDLNDHEQKLGAPGDERLDAGAETLDGAEGDAVTLLTAHSAKGLEFDTVFVVRVQPRHGFGASPRDDGPDLPPEVLGRPADGADETAAQGETRRLFYVACTRAERRLVLFAKANKTRSKSVHFFEEFTKAPEGLRLVSVRTPEDLFDEADRRGVKLKSGGGVDAEGSTAEDFKAVLARARSHARQAATMALEAADRRDLSTDQLDAITARLRDAAGRLAIAAAVEHGAATPAWAAAVEPWRTAAEALAAGRRTAAAPEFRFTPQGPRLDLSYSSLSDYLTCPRCWYVKHVMQVPDRASPELNLGVVVHRVLQVFVERRRQAEAEGRLPPGPEELARLCRQEAEREAGALRAVEAAELDQVVALARSAVEKLDVDGANVLEIEREFRFGYPRHGVRHSFTAKIDRVDQLKDGRFRIIDYKTGAARKALAEPKKDDLQMAIYAMALAGTYGTAGDADMPAPPAGLAEYWILGTGERGALPFDRIDFAKVRAVIDGVVDGLVAGRFPKDLKKCRGLCDLLGEPHEIVTKAKKGPDDDE